MARWRWPLALAASLLVALAVGFALGRGAVSPTGPITPPEISAAVPAGAAVAVPAGAGRTLVSDAEAALVAAKEDLRRSLAEHRAKLPARTLDSVDRNLATIDRAIAEIRQALAEHPGDPDLRRTLVAYHEREVALLTRVTRAAARL